MTLVKATLIITAGFLIGATLIGVGFAILFKVHRDSEQVPLD